MIEIDCGEMTFDDQLELASVISDGLAGKGIALVKDTKIVIDVMSKGVSAGGVVDIVKRFVSTRKDSRYYSIEADGDDVVVHTPDPLARSRGRRDTGQLLPDNLMKCPWCSFVTPYQELYNVHIRSHGFGL